MPRTDPETKGKRIELVYRLLERHPNGLTEREIDDMLKLGRRNVNNYLRALEIEGKLYKEGRVWFVMPYERVRLRHFELSPEEAMTLYLAIRLLVKQHDKRNESAETALVKLAEVLTGDVGVGHEIHQAALELAHRPGDERYSRVFRTMMQSYIYRRKVAITYHPMGGDPFETRLAPYLLEPSAIGYATYVIGHSSIVDTLRTYKLERVEQAALTPEEYTVPSDFPGLDILRHAWSIIHGEKLNPIKLRFHPRVARRVHESRWHPSQDIVDDPDNPGGCIWTAQVADLTDLLPWVRGWGADVEVLGPEELRERMKRETRRLARLYSIAPIEQDSPLSRLLRCWGKTGETEEEFHPALLHMLDVGHVARELLGQRASPRWRRVLAEMLGAEPDTLVDWLPWLVAQHDIGKISATFQGLNEAQKARLQTEGFSFGEWRPSLDLHHTIVGQIFVTDELAQLNSLSLPDSLQNVWKEMIGGHHGRFVSPGLLSDARNSLKGYEASEWATLRLHAAEVLKEYFLQQKLIRWPEPPHISAAIMALTGFTILCDWLGSDSRHFPARSEATLAEYVTESAQQARQAVEVAGFYQPSLSIAPTIFAKLFPDRTPPRPLQSAIDDIPADLLTAPCLAIIEAPTGEGKTEAALALAHRLAQQSGRPDELYYALPTMATSNQMFGRVQKYLSEQLALSTQAKLVHGQAFLVEDDLRLDPLNNGDGDGHEEALAWFGPKKRALLAPFGVGTIDQAELAALNVKHTALRLMGLAGKVIIVDEVHAYDTYMTTIVERLLKWLAALDTSVILLSATLPKARRTALLHAYGAEMDLTPEDDDAYPSLWVVGRTGSHHASPAAYQSNRRLNLNALHIVEDDPEAKARWLLDAVAAGGCACWITNTVDRAQKLFEAVQCLAPPDGAPDRFLLHARFPLEERQRREEELTQKYGPHGQRPQRGIVIGTQVLEQSLDLDFDLMISDLAPVDLLLQRAGRLHRHERQRPAAHRIPCFWINAELDANGDLMLGADCYIYAEFFLRQTWLALADRSEITLPADYRPLIEAVYGGAAPTPDSPLAEAWRKLQRTRANASSQANQRLLPAPDREWSFCPAAARLQFEEDENRADWIVAQTRLGPESLTIIPLERRGDRARATPGGAELDLDGAVPRDVQLQLLRRSLRLSHQEAVRALKDTLDTLPRLFSQSALLKGCVPLWLTDGQARFPLKRGELLLTLDPHLGLIISKEVL